HRLEQEAQVRALYDAVQVTGHELLLEIIPPRDLPREHDTVLRALKRFYNLGIYPEWWKLEPMTGDQWPAVDALVGERDPYCRGVLLLGLGARREVLAQAFSDAQASTTCRGFAVGRTIFEAPAREWLAGSIDDEMLIARAAAAFLDLIDCWMAARQAVRKMDTTVLA
ncbi:MAG: DUF2090 domain-containing protein, partial [Pseudomonadota bacterium]|nr:DUF2090 domain-containing protein [Pseudomonadota bacterium]